MQHKPDDWASNSAEQLHAQFMYMSEASLNKMKAPKQNLDSNELTRNDTVDLIDRFRRRRQCTADATTATNSDHVPYASRHHVPASGYATPKLLLLPATMTTLCVSNSSLEGAHLKGSGASPDCSSVSSFSVLLQKCKKSKKCKRKSRDSSTTDECFTITGRQQSNV